MLRRHAREQVGGDPIETVLLVARGVAITLPAVAGTLVVVRLRPATLPVLRTECTGSVPVRPATRPVGSSTGGKLATIELHAPHPLDRLFALDTFLFASLEDLFVLDAKLATGNVVSVQGDDNSVCLVRMTEVCESESTEDTIVVMIVERIR